MSESSFSVCSACGQPDEPYMLRHGLWNHVSRHNKKQTLCIACVEQRLGRKLKRADLLRSNPPINSWIVFKPSGGIWQVDIKEAWTQILRTHNE